MVGKQQLASELGYQNRTTFYRHVKLLLESLERRSQQLLFTFSEYKRKRLLPKSWASWLSDRLGIIIIIFLLM